MKTTIEIPDDVYLRIKTEAALRGITIKDILIHSLKAELAMGTLKVEDQITAVDRKSPIRKFKKNLQMSFSKFSFRLNLIPEAKIFQKIDFDPAAFLQEEKTNRNDLLLY